MVKGAALVLLVVLVQAVLVSPITVFGARGDIVLLLAIAAGIAAGPERGAIVGFAAGLLYDLLLTTPLGLSALTYCITGYLMGAIHSSVLRAAGWIPVVNTVVASAAGVLAYALIGRLLGQATLTGTPLPTIVAVVALLNGLLAIPFVRISRWALSPQARARVFSR